MELSAWSLCLLFLHYLVQVAGTPVSSTSWDILTSPDGIKFSGRNAHASCIFKGKIWVTGGRTNAYTMYNLQESYKVADVWKSEDGALWSQESAMTGDFYAQNSDVRQPASIAPWYARYGHSLNAIDIDGDGVQDMMVLMGGYSSYPSNDVWVTEDGSNWLFTGHAPWSARAWHSTTVFQGKLWMMGGTPLNNEVWVLDKVERISRREPLTRALYSNYTYALTWQQLPNAPWSPRVGAGLVSQWYSPVFTSVSTAQERMVLVGGYGGWLDSANTSHLYDGFYCRSDSWESYDGFTWTLLNATTSLKGRAWFGMAVLHAADPRIGVPLGRVAQIPKMYIFGGGYIGASVSSTRRVTSMIGYADAYWSRDGAQWTKISYEEGGGKTSIPFFSSQEWAQTVVDTNTAYLGMWGHTVHSFNFTSKAEFPGEFVLIAGDYTGGGDMSSSTYRSREGLYCDIEGVICNNQGVCLEGGCACNGSYAGDVCDVIEGPIVSASDLLREVGLAGSLALICLVSGLLAF